MKSSRLVPLFLALFLCTVPLHAQEPLHYAFDSNNGDWEENAIVWEAGLDGYLHAQWTSWAAAVVSRDMYSSADSIFVIARVQIESTSNYMFGFTSESYTATDFHYDGIDLGVYLHSSGTVRPTWDVDNAMHWNEDLGEGIFDVRVMIDGTGDYFRVEAEKVAAFDSPLSDFQDPDWAVSESRPIDGDYSIQVNPYNTAGHVYDLWVMTDSYIPSVLELNHVGDRVAYAGELLTIDLEASGGSPGSTLEFSTDAGDVLPSAFSFDGGSGLFEWTPQPEDTGTYEVTFSVTDGTASDSEAITVSVYGAEDLRHYQCYSNGGAWAENDVVWEQELGGYLRALSTSWYSGIVSYDMYSSEDRFAMIARLRIDPMSDYMFGFTSESYTSTDFHYDGLDLGVYLHSSGSIRPSWDVDNTQYWGKSFPAGVLDVMVVIDGAENTFEVSAVEVESFDSPLSDFGSPDWSASESRPISGDYSLQVNPYNPGGRVYDIWFSPAAVVPCDFALLPIGDKEVFAGQTLTIQLESTACGPGPLTYSTDAGSVIPSFFSFDTGTGLFEWIPEPADTGSYELAFGVTDADSTASDTITVTVLGESEIDHDQCYSNTGLWAENLVVWDPGSGGHLRAEGTSWYSAVVSKENYNPENGIYIIARVGSSPVANFMIGFTSDSYSVTDFHYDGMDLGVYMHSSGTVRPTWDVNNSGYWSRDLGEGIFDIRVMIDGTTGLFRADAKEVASYDAPLSDFGASDWSVTEARPVGERYAIQVNTYNSTSPVYDIWYFNRGQLVSTELVSWTLRMVMGHPALEWVISESSDASEMAVSRKGAGDPLYSRIGLVEAVDGERTYSFVDTDCEPGGTYSYRVSVREDEGDRVLLETREMPVPAAQLSLWQNYPNPFNPRTTLKYYLPERADVTLDIFDVNGRKVVRLVETEQDKGPHSAIWDGLDSSGDAVSSGVYFYVLRAGKKSLSRKLVLLR